MLCRYVFSLQSNHLFSSPGSQTMYMNILYNIMYVARVPI